MEPGLLPCKEATLRNIYVALRYVTPIQEVLQHAGIFVNVYYSRYGQWSLGVYRES